MINGEDHVMKVLIADDDPADRLLFKKCVKRWGYEPVEAADGLTGGKKLSRKISSPPFWTINCLT